MIRKLVKIKDPKGLWRLPIVDARTGYTEAVLIHIEGGGISDLEFPNGNYRVFKAFGTVVSGDTSNLLSGDYLSIESILPKRGKGVAKIYSLDGTRIKLFMW